MDQEQTSARQKILDKLAKMKAQAQGEAQLGNEAAAEAFAEAFNRMLLKHELSEADVDRHTGKTDEPIVTVITDWKRHWRPGDRASKFATGNKRIPWQEELARVIAKAHLCRFLVDVQTFGGITRETDTIWFVGTKANAETAEFVYTTLVLAASDMARADERRYRKEFKNWDRRSRRSEMKDYKESWLMGFVFRMGERFDEIKKKVVQEDSSGTALMRLDQALVRVGQWMEKQNTKTVKSAESDIQLNAAGHLAGIRAANKMPLGAQKRVENPGNELVRRGQ